MKLNLRKPLIFFDLETTGISATKDRIVQLGYIKVMPNGSEEQGNFFINPEMHIPEEASAPSTTSLTRWWPTSPPSSRWQASSNRSSRAAM